jgi:hypothetical protein
MSVRSFHSVFMATAVAGAALGCYLVSLRVASERAALEDVETQIVQTQSDIRLLQTEVGTRARLGQLERWNVQALSLSAPSAGQILGDKFQLARLIQPERKLDVQAPVVMASAPAPQPQQPLATGPEADSTSAPASQLLREASLTVPAHDATAPKAAPPTKPAEPKATASNAKSDTKKVEEKLAKAGGKKAGDKGLKTANAPVTRPVRTAKIDPLAPLPAGGSSGKGLHSDR